ncbi:hypothetical protein IC582_001061 [Cucumis melo]
MQSPLHLPLLSSLVRQASNNSDLQTAACVDHEQLASSMTTHSDRCLAFFFDDPFTRHRVLAHESHSHCGHDFEQPREALAILFLISTLNHSR